MPKSIQQAIIDIFEAGLNDSNLQLIYEANKKVFMGINTPEGTTNREEIENPILQFFISNCAGGYYWKGDNEVLLWLHV